jgi:hypothetical protein
MPRPSTKFERFLDLTHRIFELVVFGAILALFVGFVWRIFRMEQWHEANLVPQTIRFIDTYWKGSILIFIPLFYRAIAKAIGRVVKISGAEFETPQTPVVQDQSSFPIPASREEPTNEHG